MLQKHWNILIVDDDEVDRLVLKRSILKASTGTTYEAVSTEEGIRVLEGNTIDCAFIDYQLNDGGDGLAFYQKALERGFGHVPMILLTGLHDEEMGNEAIQLGFQDYLVKSHSDDEVLIRSIHYAIQRQEAENRMREFALNLERQRDQLQNKISNEIRVPLTRILKSMSLCKGAELGEREQQCMGLVRSMTHRLLYVVEDMIAFSKVEAGSFTHSLSDFSPRDFVRYFLEVAHIQCGSKNLSITSSVSDEVPSFLRSDPYLWGRIFFNLFENAIRFTPERGNITLTIRCEEKKERSLRITFVDSGCGMSEEQKQQALQPFTHTSSIDEIPSDHSSSGIGLGLPVVAHLLKALEGEMRIDSSPGEGALFSLSIPYKKALHPEQEGGGTQRKKLPSPLRILVAEDKEIYQKLLQHALTQALDCEFTVMQVESGEQALAAYSSFQPDLIFMDTNMPLMNGDEASQKIREQERGGEKRVPIIGMIPYTFEEERAYNLEKGMDACVIKPFQPFDIQKAVGICIN